MIKVIIFRTLSNDIYKVQVTGHAGYDESGRDLVCCAVSSIVQTAVLGLSYVADIKTNSCEEKGWLTCVIPSDTPISKREKARIILDTMLLGLNSVQINYGQYLSIEELNKLT